MSITLKHSPREKCPNTVISGPYFSVFGPEIIPFLDTFHAVTFSNSFSVYAIIVKIYVSCLEFI